MQIFLGYGLCFIDIYIQHKAAVIVGAHKMFEAS